MTTASTHSMTLDEGGPALTFRRRLEAGALSYQRCDTCGRADFRPRVVCHHGGGRRLSWHDSEGRGTVHSMSSLHPRHGDAYVVALVDLDEGFRMMTRIDADPAAVCIGMRVGVRIAEASDGSGPIAVFAPQEQEDA